MQVRGHADTLSWGDYNSHRKCLTTWIMNVMRLWLGVIHLHLGHRQHLWAERYKLHFYTVSYVRDWGWGGEASSPLFWGTPISRYTYVTAIMVLELLNNASVFEDNNFGEILVIIVAGFSLVLWISSRILQPKAFPYILPRSNLTRRQGALCRQSVTLLNPSRVANTTLQQLVLLKSRFAKSGRCL